MLLKSRWCTMMTHWTYSHSAGLESISGIYRIQVELVFDLIQFFSFSIFSYFCFVLFPFFWKWPHDKRIQILVGKDSSLQQALPLKIMSFVTCDFTVVSVYVWKIIFYSSVGWVVAYENLIEQRKRAAFNSQSRFQPGFYNHCSSKMPLVTCNDNSKKRSNDATAT